MNIPKSYEALAADLASEKILSKTLLGQKEAYMMLADKGRLDLATWKQKACEAAEREAALREDLNSKEQLLERWLSLDAERFAKRQEAEQRADELESELKRAHGYADSWCDTAKKMSAEHLGALKRVALGETVSLLRLPCDLAEFHRLQPCVVYHLGEEAIVISAAKEGAAK